MGRPKWVEKLRTEVQFEESSPVFLKSCTFNTKGYDLLQVKVEIYH